MAILGCATQYTVELHMLERVDNEGVPLPKSEFRFMGVLSEVSQIRWTRVLRNTSEAEITVDFAEATPACCELFNRIEARVTQVRIWRDRVLVWEGEVMNVEETTGVTAKTITCNDIYRRVHDMVNDFDLKYTNMSVMDVAADIITRNVLDSRYDDPLDSSLILPQMVVEAPDPDDPAPINFRRGEVSDYVGEIVRFLGQSYGLDFTVLGRSLRLQRRRTTRDVTFARLADHHLVGEVQARENGFQAAVRGWATTQLQDTSEPKDFDPSDPEEEWPGITRNFGVTGSRYGRIDVLNRVQDNQATESDVLTSAKAAVYGRNPPPKQIVIPSSARLSPAAPLTMNQLVPGFRIDFFAQQGLCKPIRQGMRLLNVEVVWNPSNAGVGQGETVNVGLSTLSDVTGT